MNADYLISLMEEDGLDLDAELMVNSFIERLSSRGHDSINVEVVIDPDFGVFVKFEDDEKDDVVVIFTFDEKGDPVVSVVSPDDEQVTIDLSYMDPPTLEVENYYILDLIDLSWMNNTTLEVLLKAGKVGPNESLSDLGAIPTRTILFGRNKVKLPIIKVKPYMNNMDLIILDRARELELL